MSSKPAASTRRLGVLQSPAFLLNSVCRTGRLELLFEDWVSDPLPVHAVYPQNRHMSGKVLGHKRSTSYCKGEKWHMGFDIVHVNSQTRITTHDYVAVSDFAVAGGKFYYRALARLIRLS